MIDNNRVFTKMALPLSASWMFDTTNTALTGPVVGISDFSGTPAFTAYFDDIKRVGSISFWSCDGWGQVELSIYERRASTTDRIDGAMSNIAGVLLMGRL